MKKSAKHGRRFAAESGVRRITDPETFRALFYSYLVGFAILIPGFIFFWRMFMGNT